MATKKINLELFVKLSEALNKAFPERENIVQGMLVALVAREHLFLLGPPGTAKSAICLALNSAIDGRFFQRLMTKFTTPEEVFGPYSLKGLENDKYERVTNGMLPDADVAFLDEIFKSSSSILNSLLTVLNERVFQNGVNNVKLPLEVMFGASNEIPESEELAALYDRFALRYVTDRLQKESSFEAMMDGSADAAMPKLPMTEIKAAQAAAEALPVSAKVKEMIKQIRTAAHQELGYISDRTWIKALRIVKANALLNGHAEVLPEDLEILQNVLWKSPDQQKDCRKIVLRLTNPIGEEILKLIDAAREQFAIFEADNKKAAEVNLKLKDCAARLKKLGDVTSNKKLADAIDSVNKMNQKVVQDMLKI